MRVLVVRPDRLGDVILSTPVLEAIKRHDPQSHVTFMIRDAVAPVIRGLSCVNEVMIYDPEGRHAGLGGFRRLVSDILSCDFDTAIVLQSHRRIAFALLFAWVARRVGPWSKIHSFICYNLGLRQHRSKVEMHEADYNLQLLTRIGISVAPREVPVQVHIREKVRQQAQEWLKAKGWDGATPLIAVHPGMGGSALNWPEEHYVDLIREMIRKGRQVLVTGGPGEGALLDRVRAAIVAQGEGGHGVMYYGGEGIGAIDFLAGLFSWANLVVAPSTGPLHLAVALHRPVITFYPPIRVQSAKRWGPYVQPSIQNESRAAVLVPDVSCEESFECRGQMCQYFPCMKRLSVSMAVERVELFLEGT